MALTGQAKIDYQREYMRRRREAVRPTGAPSPECVRPTETLAPEGVRPIEELLKQYIIPAKPYVEKPFTFVQPPVCSDRELALKFTNVMRTGPFQWRDK
jgi:hypothetical protein